MRWSLQRGSAVTYSMAAVTIVDVTVTSCTCDSSTSLFANSELHYLLFYISIVSLSVFFRGNRLVLKSFPPYRALFCHIFITWICVVWWKKIRLNYEFSVDFDRFGIISEKTAAFLTLGRVVACDGKRREWCINDTSHADRFRFGGHSTGLTTIAV